MTTTTGLRLLSRPGCHLCEEMAQTLDDLGLAYEAVNIEEDEGLSSAYGELIPVLMKGETEVARAPQSSRTLKRALMRSGVL
jgi:glutaredoxin